MFEWILLKLLSVHSLYKLWLDIIIIEWLQIFSLTKKCFACCEHLLEFLTIITHIVIIFFKQMILLLF
jgi:hypothetical protein